MSQIASIPASQIVPGNNDRTMFDPAALRDLADNIRDHGLVQPITVRPLDGLDLFQIVAGERRFRACRLLGWDEIPAIVKDLADAEASAIMLLENMARTDLDPIDEGRAYQSRMTAFGWSVADCAREAGVSEVRVQFRLKLLRLRPDLQALVRTGGLGLGYAQILADANLDVNRQMIALARLRDNPRPTPVWFRKEVSRLLEEQSQAVMFDLPLLSGNIETAMPSPALVEPPLPSTTRPPRRGKSPIEIIEHQVGFWTGAAEAWDALGKPFKRQECQAAAQALQLALSAI